MDLQVFETVEELLEQTAGFIVTTAAKTIDAEGRFNMALSGGSSPSKLYALLAGDTYRDKVNWDKVFFFLGDERYVPLSDANSNFRMIKEVLLDPLSIQPHQYFPVDTTLEPVAAAAAYEADLFNHFAGENPMFDLILLGLGDNAHTASLFPRTPILSDATVGVRAVWLPEEKVHRISFTAPLINLAHQVAFLVYGEGKAEAVYNVLENEPNEQLYPAQLIEPRENAVSWFLDLAAASRLQKVI